MFRRQVRRSKRLVEERRKDDVRRRGVVVVIVVESMKFSSGRRVGGCDGSGNRPALEDGRSLKGSGGDGLVMDSLQLGRVIERHQGGVRRREGQRMHLHGGLSLCSHHLHHHLAPLV